MVLVCWKCHQRDRLTTHCEKDYEQHVDTKWGNCPLCGKWYELRGCAGYPEEIWGKLLKRKLDKDGIPEDWRYRTRIFGPDY